MRQLVHQCQRLPIPDPIGSADLADPVAAEMALREIFDRRYAGSYDADFLRTAVADAVRAYRGEYPGLLRCDALYHDLRHALETALTMARLLDGYATIHAPNDAAGIDGDLALFGIVLALFHDIGLLRRDAEAHLWGPALTPVHEERGIEFMEAYLSGTALAALVGECRLIMATKPAYKMPTSWSATERTLASLLATADLVSQTSDRYYLEKCRDFLFLEFSSFGLAGKLDSPFPDRKALLEKTPEFFDGVLRERLDVEFQGVRRYLRVHMAGDDPWQDSMQRNVSYLRTLLKNDELDQLRRRPKSNSGEPVQAGFLRNGVQTNA
ncbi:MAG: hypothetical protein PHY45_00300 [Rhodocyclaceae bacterium]|nr:hypothetical protein [Rhodocyclaceae bacterium]